MYIQENKTRTSAACKAKEKDRIEFFQSPFCSQRIVKDVHDQMKSVLLPS